MSSYRTTLTSKRRRKILEMSQLQREEQASKDEMFDPVLFVERTAPKIIKGFDYHYDESHEYFRENPDREAVMDFTDGCQLICRESVMEKAYRGDPQSRFILCHELGHAFLHRASAAVLARCTIGSPEQYSKSKTLEIEANLFGGALLAPPSGISPLMNLFEVRRKFICSNDVAKWAIDDAAFWRDS